MDHRLCFFLLSYTWLLFFVVFDLIPVVGMVKKLIWVFLFSCLLHLGLQYIFCISLQSIESFIIFFSICFLQQIISLCRCWLIHTPFPLSFFSFPASFFILLEGYDCVAVLIENFIRWWLAGNCFFLFWGLGFWAVSASDKSWAAVIIQLFRSPFVFWLPVSLILTVIFLLLLFGAPH